MPQHRPGPSTVSAPGLTWPGGLLVLAQLLALGCAQPPVFDLSTLVEPGGDGGVADGGGTGGGGGEGTMEEPLPPAVASGDPVWRVSTGMSVEALGMDPDGNVVVVGSANVPGKQGEIAISKYTAAGVPIWKHTYGGVGQQSAMALAIAGDGTIVVTGSFQAETDFGGVVRTAMGGTDVFVAAYSPEGLLKRPFMVHTYGSFGEEYGMGVVIDKASGEWLVTGHGSADFSVGPNKMIGHFLFRIIPDGTPRWGTGAGRNLIVSSPDAVYVAGSGKGQVSRHMPATGMVKWASALGQDIHPSAGVVDGTGRLLLTGGFYGALTTEMPPIISFGKRDAFLVALSPEDGKPLWTKVFLASYGEDSGRAMCIDSIGNIYIGGRYFGTSALAPGDMETVEQPFVAKHAADGAKVWTHLYRPGSSTSSVLCGAKGGIVAGGDGWLMMVLP